MRIISGKYKGRVVSAPKGGGVRPTPDMVRGAIFSILGSEVIGARFLDLFAGTGAVGIEALSRGAAKTVFCEIDAEAHRALRENLTFCAGEDAEVFRGDYADFLFKAGERNEQFDIIFCDPPYSKRLGEEIARRVLESGALKTRGSLIIERAAADPTYRAEGYTLESSRKYGGVALDFFRPRPVAAVTGVFDPFTKGHGYLVERALRDFSSVRVAVLNNEKKAPRFDVEKRLELIRAATAKYKKRVSADYFDGAAVDYLHKHNIQYIIRGVRGESDMAYEREMAEYNEKCGGIKTLFIPAADPSISSTLVREEYNKGADVTEYVGEEVAKLLKK